MCPNRPPHHPGAQACSSAVEALLPLTTNVWAADHVFQRDKLRLQTQGTPPQTARTSAMVITRLYLTSLYVGLPNLERGARHTHRTNTRTKRPPRFGCWHRGEGEHTQPAQACLAAHCSTSHSLVRSSVENTLLLHDQLHVCPAIDDAGKEQGQPKGGDQQQNLSVKRHEGILRGGASSALRIGVGGGRTICLLINAPCTSPPW
jgi:hypothetical protein